jgi:dienelactone hydrolase
MENSKSTCPILCSAFAAVTLLCACVVVSAGEKAPADTSRSDRMLAEYFRAETARLRDRCMADIEDLNDWQAKRPVYRRQLLEMLGLDPLPENTDLKATVTGKIEHDEFTVENLHFQSRPGLYVTANIYVPKGLDKPVPAILYLCGHGRVKKDNISYGNKVYYQHHPAWFARHGYVCLVIDSLQLGEIEGIHHGTYSYKMWWWNSRGYTPAGVEAWNCVRSIDYLQTRSEVDKERIGVTGRSGGGAYSWWIAAIDDRIKAAVPVAGITDLQNHVVDGCVEGHCDCMYVANTYRWDYPLVAALLAPRPLLISNSDKDNIFPLDGVIRLHEKVRKIYGLYGAEKNLGLQITEGPHSDTQELRVHAFVWFNRFLKDQNPLIDKPAVPFFEPEQLRVFEKLPADEINTNIHESFVPENRQPSVPDSAGQWTGLRQGWMQTLRQKVFAGWPTEPQAGPLDVSRIFSVRRHGLRFSAYEFTSQPHVRLCIYLLQTDTLDRPEQVTLNVLDEARWTEWLGVMQAGFAGELGGQLTESNENAIREMQKFVENGTGATAYLAPRGIGPTAWNADEKKQTQIRRRFMLLGQTLDGMRVWDVRRAIQALRAAESVGKASINLRSEGVMAGVALYASLFEPNLAALELSSIPASHRNGPTFLNVLRYLDMPQALAMAAERSRVRLYQTEESAWQFPRKVIRQLGWPQERLEVSEKERKYKNKADSLNTARIIRVGPGKRYKMPSLAAEVAADGDVVEIDAGVYESDACVWRQNNLTIRGVGGYAHLKANGVCAQGKAIWVIKGRNTTVEHIEFSGAKVPDRNGAGIRIEGAGLTVRHCYFHGNEMGILGGSGKSDIVIEFTEFAHNGHGDGYSHNIYIGHARSLTVRHCYSHHARIGHNLKSRAHENSILYNRIMDEADGNSSYAVDLPNGGRSFLIGNVIQQGPNTDNATIVSYGAEGLSNPGRQLYMVNNTVVNDRQTGTFVYIREGSEALLANNLFAGKGRPFAGSATELTNLTTEKPGFVGRANFDYRLKADSPAIDKGSDPGSADRFGLKPLYQYVHPANREKRPSEGTIDIGAYEHTRPGP